jgi:hypothetical protein
MRIVPRVLTAMKRIVPLPLTAMKRNVLVIALVGPASPVMAVVGWAFALSAKLELRIGGGAQYIRFGVDTNAGRLTTSTPFVAIDAVLGYRL